MEKLLEWSGLMMELSNWKSTDFKFYLYTNLVGLLLHLSRLPSRKKSEFARKNSFLRLAYYTIERHTPKNLTMVNRWWTDKAILCCQQEVEIDFRLHFDPRLWKPLGWKSAETFQEVLNTWFQPDFIWVLFFLRSWKSTRYMSCCETKNYPLKVRFLQRWFQRNYLWMFSVTFLVHGDHLLATPHCCMITDKREGW